MSIIAERLISAREAANLTQEELANQLGITQEAYGAYERRRTLPGIDRLMEIAQQLNRPVTYFLDIDRGNNNKFTDDETDLLRLYRLIPAYLRDTALSVLRSLTKVEQGQTANGPVNDQQMVEVVIPERNEATVPDPEEIISLLRMLDEPERYFVYDYIIWRLQDQTHRRNSSGQRTEQQPHREPETIEIIELLLAVHGADELAIEQVIGRLRKMQTKLRMNSQQVGANEE